MEVLLTDKEYHLERFSGKGGWTYISLPEIPKDKEAAFGIVKVKGTIDSYELSDVTLMLFSGMGGLLTASTPSRPVIWPDCSKTTKSKIPDPWGATRSVDSRSLAYCHAVLAKLSLKGAALYGAKKISHNYCISASKDSNSRCYHNKNNSSRSEELRGRTR